MGNNNKKNKKGIPEWIKVFLPPLIPFIFIVIGYFFTLHKRIDNIERDMKNLATTEQISNKTNELQKEITKEIKTELNAIKADIHSLDKNITTIDNFLKFSVSPKLEKLTGEEIPSYDIQNINARLNTFNQHLKKLDTHYASIQEELDKTNFLLSGSLPENIITVEGTIKSIDRTKHTMEFWSYEPVIAEQSIPDKISSLMYTLDTYVSVSGEPPIVDIEKVQPEQKAIMKYFKWKGELYIKSIEILKKPIIKNK